MIHHATLLILFVLRARRVKVSGDSLFLFGKSHIAEVSVADPQKPRVVALLDKKEIGRVSDVEIRANRLYLLGDRGLQIAGRKAEWVEDSIQVDAGRALQLSGRFAFAVGGRNLEIIDLAPYQTQTAAAAPAP